jgi:acetoin utilization deacetylase AcuC-like enzyme
LSTFTTPCLTRSFDGGTFYPGSMSAGPAHVGEGPGKGFNVNVAWNTRGVGDME